MAVPALAAILLLAWAMQTPAEPKDERAAATSTTAASTTSSTAAPSTTSTTTTTIPIATTPEGIAAEIEMSLAQLRPPDFHPKDVKDIGDKLDQVMREWEEGDQDKVAGELKSAVEKVDKLSESSERDDLLELFDRLADAMGIDIENLDEDDDDD
jgi:hypothetical protein